MIEGMQDVEALERLIRLTFTSATWQELLAEAPGR
jgi:hypothetical protein